MLGLSELPCYTMHYIGSSHFPSKISMSIVVRKLHLPPKAMSVLSTLNADSDVFAFSSLVVPCTVTNLSMIVAMNWLIVMTEIVLQISFKGCKVVTDDRKFCRLRK